MSGAGARLNVFPTRQNLQVMKTKLVGAKKGHSLLKKKAEGGVLVYIRWRYVCVQCIRVHVNALSSLCVCVCVIDCVGHISDLQGVLGRLLVLIIRKISTPYEALLQTDVHFFRQRLPSP